MPVSGTRGPLTIFSYDRMRLLLVDGTGAQRNALFDKISGAADHGGGNRCAAGLASSPCKEVAQWWDAEIGGGSGGGAAVRGKITQVTALGKVFGWAADPADTTAALAVKLYVDGPAGAGGTEVATVTADFEGADGNTPGAHAFTFQLPDSLRDKKAHDLYAYAMLDGELEQLGSTAFAFTAFAFSQAGRDFFEANVRSQLGGCTGCHTVSYEQQFYSLLVPSPAAGGTAANNQLVNKPAQANGTTHGGGSRCGGVNAGVCAQIQAWWRVEFGN
jgi:hypothetical protein